MEEIYGPAYEMLILIPYPTLLPLNAHADISSGARALKSHPSLHLHPYFVYGSSGGSGKSVNLRRLA